jgi:hypothetical protein
MLYMESFVMAIVPPTCVLLYIYQYAIQWSLRMRGQESTVVTLSLCPVWVSRCRSGTTSTLCQANSVLSVWGTLLEHKRTFTSHFCIQHPAVLVFRYVYLHGRIYISEVSGATYIFA